MYLTARRMGRHEEPLGAGSHLPEGLPSDRLCRWGALVAVQGRGWLWGHAGFRAKSEGGLGGCCHKPGGILHKAWELGQPLRVTLTGEALAQALLSQLTLVTAPEAGETRGAFKF